MKESETDSWSGQFERRFFCCSSQDGLHFSSHVRQRLKIAFAPDVFEIHDSISPRRTAHPDAVLSPQRTDAETSAKSTSTATVTRTTWTCALTTRRSTRLTSAPTRRWCSTPRETPRSTPTGSFSTRYVWSTPGGAGVVMSSWCPRPLWPGTTQNEVKRGGATRNLALWVLIVVFSCFKHGGCHAIGIFQLAEIDRGLSSRTEARESKACVAKIQP